MAEVEQSKVAAMTVTGLCCTASTQGIHVPSFRPSETGARHV